MTLTVVQETEFKKKVYTDNSLLVGTFEMDVDGFYNYWEDENLTGHWDSQTLRAIADKLDEVNKPFQEEINKYFSENSCEDEEFDLDLWGAKY